MADNNKINADNANNGYIGSGVEGKMRSNGKPNRMVMLAKAT